jgi:hypothetical protein
LKPKIVLQQIRPDSDRTGYLPSRSRRANFHQSAVQQDSAYLAGLTTI